MSIDAELLHRSALVIDGHNDLPWQLRKRGLESFESLDIATPQPELHTDIPRMRAGGLGGQFFVAYVPCEEARSGDPVRYTLEQIDLIHRLTRRHAAHLEAAVTVADVHRIRAAGRIACLIGIENGQAIGGSLGALRMFARLGAVYMTLTHADTTDWCDAATDAARHGGLSPFGEQVVLEMNRLGMLVDIAHVSPDAMRHALRVSRAPILSTHSGAYAVAPHPRNVPDDVLRGLRDKGGLCMVNFASSFLTPEAVRVTEKVFDVDRDLRVRYPDTDDFERAWNAWRAEHPFPRGDVGGLIDHIDHIVQVAGVDHVGLGSDFDGIAVVPEGLEDVSAFPNITRELVARGYDEQAIRKILGGNLMRVLAAARELAEA